MADDQKATVTETARLISVAIDACHAAASSTKNGFVSDDCENAVERLRAALRQLAEDDANGN